MSPAVQQLVNTVCRLSIHRQTVQYEATAVQVIYSMSMEVVELGQLELLCNVMGK